MDRRDFLKGAPAALALVSSRLAGSPPPATNAGRDKIEPFDYQGVKLGESRWRRQCQHAREYYLGVSDDDILKGYRVAAGLPAPGTTLGGWCERNSSTVLGQWLSGMARLYKATGDAALRDKAVRLMSGFAATVRPDGNCGMPHYPFDKLVCGLVDLQLYAGHQDAVALLEKTTDFAIKNFNRDNLPAAPSRYYQGRPSEWYTLAENLYRAYQLTGNPRFKTFAETWLYHPYWSKFAATSAPPDAHGVHAYSHVNTFSSCAMAYAVEGDDSYLRILKNAYDYLQNFQCYATGGFGPTETFMAPDGSLGKALDTRSDTCETVCGSWAVFKMSRYLMQFTGEARYGDWIERMFYNGIGASLEISGRGRNFYYADYRVGGGMKVYNWETYTCCSGTYIQNMADYHNIIYYKDASSLYVNLYVPSEVTWSRPEGDVRLVQQTDYPESETTVLTLELKRGMDFPLRFRVPEWARDASVQVNGAAVSIECKPGAWASISRTWNSGDKVEIRIPLTMRMLPVDRFHPNRVAVARGPVVLVLEAAYHDPAFHLPDQDADLSRWLVADNAPTPHGAIRPGDIAFRVQVPGGRPVREKFLPFYAVGEVFPYRMYFDTKSLPYGLW